MGPPIPPSSSSAASAAAAHSHKSHLRPEFTRAGSSSHILSYYQSPLADGPPHQYQLPPPTDTAAQDSGSEYSSEADSVSDYEQTTTTAAPAATTSTSTSTIPQRRLRSTSSLRKASTLSKGASDRRRLAVVEMESPTTTTLTSPSPSSSAHHRYASEHSGGSLALVAPPDAYMMNKVSKSASESSSPSPLLHLPPPLMTRRSTGQSVVTPGIGDSKESSAPVASPIVSYLDYKIGRDSTAGPLPQPPRSPPMSPTPLPSSSSSLSTSSPQPLPFARVTSPPPPPPPMRSSARKRDKKSKQSLQPPVAEVTANTRSNSPLRSEVEPSPTSSSHRREGAISPAVISLESNTASSSFSALPPPEPISVASSSQSVSHSVSVSSSAAPNEDGWISVTSDSEDAPQRSTTIASRMSRTPSARTSGEFSSSSHSSSAYSASHTGATPPPPPKSFRNTITKGIRRMSINASRSSLDRSKSPPPLPPLPMDAVITSPAPRGSSLPSSSSSNPLPPLPHQQQTQQPQAPRVVVAPKHRAPLHKTVSMAPPALFCHEVWQEKAAPIRCEIYAGKINDLWRTDCGLADFLNDAAKGHNKQVIKEEPELEDEDDMMVDFQPQHRHASRGSEVSEMTFPRRPDATTATEISSKYEPFEPEGSKDTGSERTAETLPYPALAKVISPTSGYASSTSTSSSSPGGFLSASKATGFFHSLGRKGSVSSGSTASSGPLSKTGRLTKRPNNLPTHVPKTMISAPSGVQHLVASPAPSLIPGGPRMPSTRVARSRTLMPAPTSFHPSPSMETIERKHHETAEEEQDLVLISRKENLSSSLSADSHSTPQTHGPRKLQRNRTSYQPPPSPFPANPQGQGKVLSSLPSLAPPLEEAEFAAQLTRLGDLLPHVESSVLATYLRRAGQDVKAVGMYIADEQAGRIR